VRAEDADSVIGRRTRKPERQRLGRRAVASRAAVG
jgi:hypothetical protein